jgi:galactokinase
VAQKTAGAREAYNRAAALSAGLIERWRAVTGRDDATLYEAVTSEPNAYARLREALGTPRADGFTPAELEARLDQFVDETLVLIPAAFGALEAGDVAAFGRAVDRSQRGAEKGLRNQVPETIDLVRLARSLGAHAASAFGAGFGGSVWAIVPRGSAEGFSTEWERQYGTRHQHKAAAFFVTEAGPPVVRLGLQ